MRPTIFGTFLSVLVLAFPGPVHAQGTGSVTYVQGKAEAARAGGAATQLKPGHVLKAGDRIVTGANAALELRMDEGAMLKLGEKTNVELVSLARGTSGKRTEIKVQQGKVRALTARLSSNDTFQVRGPASLAGASGSDLGAEIGGGDEIYLGFDGKLYSAGSDEKPEPLPVYQAVRYRDGRKVAGPMPMAGEDYRDWEAMTFQTPGVARASITSQPGVDEREAVVRVVRELADTYERRRMTAFLRLWNDDRFRGYNQLERDVESDFELFRDIRLLYTNARVTLAPGGRALFEADWEKRYVARGDTADQKQAGRMQLLLEKEKGKWLISGMSGERIFGAAGGLSDLSVTGLDLSQSGLAGARLRASRQASSFPAASVTALLPATITATVKNAAGPRVDNVVVRFFEGSSQIGSDQRVSVPRYGTAQASVSWTPQLPLGTRLIKAVVDPDARVADANRSNNTGQRQVDVKAGDAVLTVTPSTVTFPSGLAGDASVTIRVVDADRDNENRVNVVVRSTYLNDMGGPCALGTETETFELTKVSTGTFQRTSIPTCKSTDCMPASINGRFEFRTSGGCASSITVTVSYTEPLTSTGQTNVERTTTFTAN